MTDQNSQFFAILTAIGEAKQANADALGVPWTFSQMGVGDANGADPVPSRTQTSLINERRRAPLNQLKVDPENLNIIIAEQVIPPDVGGWWIREIGLYDTDGDLVAVANCAPSFKPLLSQGTGKTQVVRLNIIVTSTANVQLKIDPSVVLATREWVTEELAKQDFKHSVLAATTAAITLSGVQTIDGIVLTAGARVLVKNQAAAKDNGLYQVVAGGLWTRCADADTTAKVTPGMLVLVEKGTLNGDSAWQLVTDSPITLGTSGLSFEMAFGRTGVAASTYRSVTVDKYGRVVSAANPTTAAGYGLTDVYTMVQIDTAMALKAPLASPTFTGIPAGPTAAAGTNTTQLATTAFVAALGALKANLASPTFTGVPACPTAAPGSNTAQLANTAFVQAAIAALVASSPAALDTLNELAAALGNDPNFATTITNLLALKAPLESPIFTGSPQTPTPQQFDADTSIATTEFVQRALGSLPGDPILVSANITLVNAQAGNLFLNTDTWQITLPSLAVTPNGSAFHFLFMKEGGSLKGSGTETIQGISAANSYTAYRGEKVTVVKRNNAWYLGGGGLGAEAFLANIGTNGYQKLASGLIVQWGRALVPLSVATANMDTVFPMLFPNACLSVVASTGLNTSNYDNNANFRTDKQSVSIGTPSASGFDAQVFIENNVNDQRVMNWHAVGY
ncbi:phage tail protein [Pseudomonas sp. H9]|uniref:phage tail protein n=1 Tax=Pseudomonas sp. H9 TaxID=483968 RepID=UPI001057FAAF|nr:phage tail protein [Pseudomonas sp. H9]